MKMRAENERQRSVNDFCGLRIFGDWQKIGRAVFFGGIDGLSPAYDRLLQLKSDLKMSVNGASMIFVYCIFFTVEHITCILCVTCLSTVGRAQLRFCPFPLPKVGVTYALHIFADSIFGSWKQRVAVICLARIARRCAADDRLKQLTKDGWALPVYTKQVMGDAAKAMVP